MTTYPFTLIRSRRKSVGIHIKPDSSVVVRAPRWLGKTRLNAIIKKKGRWIQRHQQRIQKKNALRKQTVFEVGETFLYLGRHYPLSIATRTKPALILNGGFSLAERYHRQAREVFVAWYKEHAHKEISQRVEYFARLLAVSYSRIRITSARSRWGSCSRTNNLNFSWRLIMAPLEVVDYVIAHELMHVQEKNHGRRFWQKVATIIPDYKTRKQWLHRNEHIMTI